MYVLSQERLPVGATIAGAGARGDLQRLESRGRERLGLLLQMVHTNRQERQPQSHQRLDERYYTR